MDVSGTDVPMLTAPPNTPAVQTPETQPVSEPIPEVPVETPAVQQVLVFETEPSVKFAEHDTVFDTENQFAHRIRSKSADLDEDGIKILDDAPSAMDGFEDINEGLDDFETLE